MVQVNDIEKDKLYENMVQSEKAAYDAQDLLLNTIEKWFKRFLDDETSDKTKIILSQGGLIQIRTISLIDEEIIEKFSKEFGFSYSWFKDEFMTDYRNQDPVSIRVYEYAFIPTNIQEILGDNQVSLEE